MTQQETAHPIEMDRTLNAWNREIEDEDGRELDLSVWVSRDDFPGVVIEPADHGRQPDMICLNLLGAIKLRDALNNAIKIMGAWKD